MLSLLLEGVVAHGCSESSTCLLNVYSHLLPQFESQSQLISKFIFMLLQKAADSLVLNTSVLLVYEYTFTYCAGATVAGLTFLGDKNTK